MRNHYVAAAAALSLCSLFACAPQASDARMGTSRPAKDPSCDLTVIDAMDTANFAKYEQVGIVRVSNEEAGTDPMDPKIRAIVRPRACALGGDAISVLASGDARNARSFRTTAFGGYIVWAKKSDKPATPQKF